MISQRCSHLNSNLPVSVLGHGVVAHKAIKDLCTLAGIKDIYVKIEGNTKNKITLTHAFFNAMTHQVGLIQNGDKVKNQLILQIISLTLIYQFSLTKNRNCLFFLVINVPSLR